MSERVMLLDTASLYFRAFYGLPTTIKAPDGTPVNALRGLLDFMSRLVVTHRPTSLVAAWDDDWRPKFRVDAVPSYKAHRVAEEDEEEVPDELAPQVDLIIEVLDLIGIPRIGAAGFEADDVIATLATRTSAPVLIVTGDRDLFQLIDDSQPIKVLYTAAKGVLNAELIDDAAVRARYGVGADQYADFALLRGDPSDGLPGVRGIGEKTAAKLIGEFGSVSALFEAVSAGSAGLTPAMTKKLADGVGYVDQAEAVVLVVRDIDLPPVSTTLPAAPADPAGLALFADQWGVESAVERLAVALAW